MLTKYLLLFSIITLIIIYISYLSKSSVKVLKPIKELNQKPYLWLYWENKYQHKKPSYIELCHKTVKRNCSDMIVRILDEKTVLDYLPNLRDLSKLSIPHKADYIRLALLSKYGGVWLDSDVIVFKTLRTFIEYLKKYDFVGFGCHDLDCRIKKNGRPKPANWTMISRKNGVLVTRCLKQVDTLLDKKLNMNSIFNYHKIGRELLWKNIRYLLRNTNWDYYHHTSIGIERDVDMRKITNDRLMSKIDKKEILKYPNDAYFLPVYNTAPGFPAWFLSMDEGEILEGDILMSYFFRKALK
tara:strand:+ start:5595 stop:6488 length:894 start_codon:yes stop_codon:yes gene_type:complete